jgi:LysR family transcriptional regulator of beta-lactamase
MVQAAIDGCGIALAPLKMFRHYLEDGRLVQASPITVRAGSYWLTRLKSRAETPAMKTFSDWLLCGVRDLSL